MNVQQQPKICVVIRKRPLNKKEIQRNEQDIVAVKNGETVIVSEYKYSIGQKVDLTKYIEESAFNFDYAFDETTTNDQIYIKAVRPLVQSAFLGARVTCFAYGQTGSGKTYTMNGQQGKTAGLYILGAKDIFALQSQKQYSHLKVTVSFFEIYCGRLFDLLKGRNELKLREDNKANIHIVGLEEKPIFTPQEFMQVIYDGSNVRITSQNSTNAQSSRSHAILQIVLKDGKKIHGKISFIDLAGCQRGADHMDQNKQTRIDGAEINKSLLSLKECIRALDQGKGHTPFRGSKLTMVLKDSFVGFCKTVMIGNISPNISSCQNTLNTLRYADRVKELKKPGDKEPMSKEDQLAKELMLPRMNKNAVKIMIDSNDDAEDIQQKKNEAQRLLGIRGTEAQMPQPPPPQPQNFDKYGGGQHFQQGFGNQFQNPQQLNPSYYNMQHQQQQLNILQQQQFAQHQRFQQQPFQQQQFQPPFNQQMGNNPYNYQQPQQPQQPNPPVKKVQDDSKIVRKFSMEMGAPVGLNPQRSVGVPTKKQETLDTKATITPNNYGLPQRGNFGQDEQNGNNRTIQLRPNSQNNQFISGMQYGYAQNSKMEVEPPQPMQRANNYFQQQNQFSQQAPQPPQKSQPNMMQQPTLRPQQFQEQRAQPQPTSQNFDWNKVVAQFSDWHPAPNQQQQMAYFRDAHEFLINKLMEQQDHITNEHSVTINKEIEMIKDEMKVLGQIQKDRGSFQSIEYADIIENAVDQKLAHLLQLKKKVTLFKQHLLEHQQCQTKIFMAREGLDDDEQLLDNLDEEGGEQRLF